MVTNTKHQRTCMSRNKGQVTVPSRTLPEEQPEHPGKSHVENILPHTGVNTLKTDNEATSCRQRAGGHQRAANQPQMGSASEQEQHRTVKTIKKGRQDHCCNGR